MLGWILLVFIAHAASIRLSEFDKFDTFACSQKMPPYVPLIMALKSAMTYEEDHYYDEYGVKRFYPRCPPVPPKNLYWHQERARRDLWCHQFLPKERRLDPDPKFEKLAVEYGFLPSLNITDDGDLKNKREKKREEHEEIQKEWKHVNVGEVR